MKKVFFFVCLALFFKSSVFAKGMPNEYFDIKNSKESKLYFFNYINKLVQAENTKILSALILALLVMQLVLERSSIVGLNMPKRTSRKDRLSERVTMISTLARICTTLFWRISIRECSLDGGTF